MNARTSLARFRFLAVLGLGVAVASCGGGGGGGGGESPPPPGFLVTLPANLEFSVIKNAPDMPSKSFRIINSGVAAFSWTASANVPWVLLGTAAGSCAPNQTSVIDVSVSTSVLAPGLATGAITVVASSANGSPKSIPVTFDVLPAGPIISLSAPSLTFTSAEGGAPPANQFVGLSNAGIGTLNVIATPNARWISVSPSTPAAPANLSVGIDQTGLGAGTYFGFVTIWSSDSANSPVRLGVSLTVSPASGAPVGDKWTILVYMNADNNVEGAGLAEINEMEAAGVPSDVNVIVLVDRHPGYDTSNGNWTNPRIYQVTADGDPSTIGSTLLSNEFELNRGDPNVLYAFCQWGIANYPADKYALVFWNHGGGWQTAGIDETSDDSLTLPEMSSALQAVQTAQGGGFLFDLVVFNECLMGQLEVATEVALFARVMVASEEVMLATGCDYGAVLSYLASNSNASPQALGVRFASSYAEFYRNNSPPTDNFTISVLELPEVIPLLSAVDSLALTLQSEMGAEYAPLTRIREVVEKFESNAPDFLDLGDFCTALRQVTSSPTVQADCDAVIAALQSTLLFTDSGSDRPHPISGGLSIYFPQDNAAQTLSDYQNGCAFAAVITSWVDMVDAYYATLASDTTEPQITGLSLSGFTVGPTGSLDGTTIFSDNADLQDVTIFTALDTGTALIFLEFQHVCAPASIQLADGRIVDEWGPGPYQLDFTWLPQAWVVSDGLSQFQTALEFGCGGPDAEQVIEVSALFRRGAQGPFEATLFFDSATGEFQSAVITVGNASAEIELLPGDELDILAPGVDLNTSQFGSFVSGTFTIETGVDLFLTTAPLPAGDYFLGVLAVDLTGNSGVEIESITVTP